MVKIAYILRRIALPAVVFVGVALVHFVWTGLFPEENPAQQQWVVIPAITETSWLRTYIETQSYWLGYSYALAFSFASVALQWYREQGTCTSRNAAIGGFTFSGLLAVGGCFLIGCCGSPMLIVYMNLFGAAFLPLAKPLMAGITTVSIILAGIWMYRKSSAARKTFDQTGSVVLDCDCGAAHCSPGPKTS
jgi:hypothetical protein